MCNILFFIPSIISDMNTEAANWVRFALIIDHIFNKPFECNISLYPCSLFIKLPDKDICIVVSITMSTPTTILVLDIRYKGNTNIVGLDIEYKWNITVVIACYSFFPSVPKTAPTKSEPEREKVRTLEIS